MTTACLEDRQGIAPLAVPGDRRGGATRSILASVDGMRRLRMGSEDEMIAVSLGGEFTSDRFGPIISDLLRMHGIDRRVVTSPDLADAPQDAQRRDLLARYRGYGTDADDYLSRFPTHGVRWERVGISPDELIRVRYINWSYWLEPSGGSRRPSDAAERIRAGIEAYGASNTGYLVMAERVAAGQVFAPLILAEAHESQDLVVVEGHARLSAYALELHRLPDEIEVLVGSSAEIEHWPLY